MSAGTQTTNGILKILLAPYRPANTQTVYVLELTLLRLAAYGVMWCHVQYAAVTYVTH